MDNKLFIQEENLEFLYDYKEASHLLDLFHKYIQICRDDRNYCTGCSYQTVMNTWKKHILSLAKEQYNNFKIGNFFSTAMMNRAIIESYVSVLCIKKYQKEEIWKEWYLKANLYSLKQVNYPEKFARMYKKLCDGLGTDYEQIKTEVNQYREYSWMHKIVPEKKRITFRNLCELVDESDIGVIYKDYKHMSDYIHVQDAYIKMFSFTFYEIIYEIFFVMIFYTKESLMLFIDSDSDTYNELEKIDREMNYLLAYLHDEILGKNPNITKILEDKI